jgi:hypothetical protein
MRVQIPEHFKVQTKFLGLPVRQIAVLSPFGAICVLIALLPLGPAGYLAISLLALTLTVGTFYLLFEQLEFKPTPARLALPPVLATALVLLASALMPVAAAASGFYVEITGDLRIRAWGIFLTAVSGIVFTFADVIDFLKDFMVFRKAPKDAGWIDESVRSLVPVERVENDLVYLKDGGIRSVYSMTPISADSLREEQRRGIYRRYREFLNSINGEERQVKVQIVMRMTDMTQRLEEYFERGRKMVSMLAEKENNKRLLQHFLALENLMTRMIRENKPLVPRFYLVINHDILPQRGLGALARDPEEARRLQEINNTAQIISEKLQEAGLKDIKRLNTNELATLYRGFLTGLDEVDVNFMSIITQASICLYCGTDRSCCRRCVEQGGDENMFSLEDAL